MNHLYISIVHYELNIYNLDELFNFYLFTVFPQMSL